MQLIQTLITLMSSFIVFNTDGPTYTTIMKEDNYELRKYDSWIVAETIVQGQMEKVGSEAFHRLGGYIFGNNQGDVKIKMTAPVTQSEVAPGKYAVQFYMPAEWTLDTLPKPNDERVVLKTMPERNLFVVTYHGSWEQNKYEKEVKLLQNEAKQYSIQIDQDSQPIWARYNSPMTPVPLRTNEVMYEVKL